MSSTNAANDQDADQLILVDTNDREIGSESKLTCHLNDGILHRAFSVFLFNPYGELLIQQRSTKKMLWGGYWANSCCSHPRVGEEILDAAHRRIAEELGVRTELDYLYKFVYQAQFGDIGAEHENCSVFAGKFDGAVDINPDEIDAWRFISPDELTRELADEDAPFSPWFRLEWEQVRQHYLKDYI